MKLVMRSTTKEIQRRSNREDLSILNGSQSSRRKSSSQASTLNKSKLDEDLMIVTKQKILEDSRGMKKVFYLRDQT